LLVIFQSDLLGKHHISGWQRFAWYETPARYRAVGFVQFMYVCGGTGPDSVAPTGMAADNVKIASRVKLSPLIGRQRSAHQLKAPQLRVLC
jgi:hypothetical protein